ncbi:MAG: cob(I)yrinic acid a,c-diamide adenosyltransferase [Acidimicrobiales bacterium]
MVTVKVKIYTRTGDDGTTGLLYGGRVGKDSLVMHINGAVDEAQAAIGAARAESEAGSEIDAMLIGLERDLYVLMAEVATDPSKRMKLVAAKTLVTADMVTSLESRIDELIDRFEMPTEFVIAGENRVSAALDVARTVVRRAERLAVSYPVEGSFATRYLNRLSDLLWAMARWAEGDEHLLARGSTRTPRHVLSEPRTSTDVDGGDATAGDEGKMP